MLARRDSAIYATLCPKLGARVAVKVYDKAALSPSKLRAVKREAAMMIMMQRKRCAPLSARAHAASQELQHPQRVSLSSAVWLCCIAAQAVLCFNPSMHNILPGAPACGGHAKLFTHACMH